jgi:hypothetical protein
MTTKSKPAQNHSGHRGQLPEHPLVEALRTADTDQQEEQARKRINRALLKPELWGATEVGACLGIAHNNLYKLPDLPEPVLELNRGRLWDAVAVRAYAAKKRRTRAKANG